MRDGIFPVLAGVVAAVLFFIGWNCGIDRGESNTQEKAIRAGHAEWVADASGMEQFKWKEAKL